MTIPPKNGTRPKECAKSRRQNENRELTDLAQLLPLPDSVAPQLDKASVIRLTTSYLKLRKLFPGGLGREWGESTTAFDSLAELGKFLNKALHGFVFVLGPDATILYISEEASAQLGYSQVQITGKSFWEFIHTYDAEEVKAILCFEVDIPAVNVGNTVLEDVEVPRSFAVRMKCILPKRQAELAVDGYKVIHCRGYLKLKRKPPISWDGPSNVCYEVIGVVATGHSLSPTPSAELKLHRRDFMFRTGLSLKFVYIEPGSQKITGYEPMQLKDKSLYKFIHPCDCKQIQDVHILTVKKTQAISTYYRFLTKYGGWIWIQSSCVVIANNKADRDHCILFVNSVLSEREYSERLLDMEQLQAPSSNSGQSNPSKKQRVSNKAGKKTSNTAQKVSSSISPKLTSNLLHKSGSSGILIPSTQLPNGADIVQVHPFGDAYGHGQHDLQSALTEPQITSDNYYRNVNGICNLQSSSALNTSDSYTVHDTQSGLCYLQPIVNAISHGQGSPETVSVPVVTEFGASKGGHQVTSTSYLCQSQILESSHTSFSYGSSAYKNSQAVYSVPFDGDFSNNEVNDSDYSFATLAKENTNELSDCSLPLPYSIVDSDNPVEIANGLMDFQNSKFKSNTQLLQLSETLNCNTSNNPNRDCHTITDSSARKSIVEVKSEELNERNALCALPSDDLKNNILLSSSNQYHLNGVQVFTPYSSADTHFNDSVNINPSNMRSDKVFPALTVSEDIPASEQNQLQFIQSLPLIDLTANVVGANSFYNITEENISSVITLDQSTINCTYQQNDYDISHNDNSKDSSVVSNNSSKVLDLLFSSPIDKACQIISSTPINQTLGASHRENENLENSRSLFHTVLDVKRAAEVSATEHLGARDDTDNLTYKSHVVKDYTSSNPLQTTSDSVYTKCQAPGKDFQTRFDYHWNKMIYQDSVPKTRSDSVSSVSLGYMSGSSNFDQSSPYSGFSESACSSNQSEETLLLGSHEGFSNNYNV